MLYAAYGRVSTEEQQKDETIDAQIDNIKTYFKTNKITISKDRWYLDDGVSGELMLRDRPDGARLLLDAVEGKFTHLVVTKVDRIARDDYAAQEAFHTLKKMGVLLISLSEPFNYFEPSGQMMATVFSSFAAYDRATIKRNLADGKARKARKGILPQGSIAYGYRINDDGIVEIHPEQAEIVKLVYKLYLEDDMSLRDITAYLTSMDIPTPADYKKKQYRSHNCTGDWSEYAVNSMLRRDIYSSGVYMYKPPLQEPIPVPIPVLIEPETYKKARQMAKARRRSYLATDRIRNYLLSGMVECAVCGSAYVGSSNSNGRFVYYRCSKRKTGSESCKNRSINADLLEEIVWEDLCGMLENPDRLVQEVALEMETKTAYLDNYVAEIKEIDKRINEIKSERKRLLDLFAKDIMTDAELTEAVAEREESLETLKERKIFVEEQLRLQNNQDEVLDTIAEIISEIEIIPDDADYELKRDLIKIFVDRVKVYPGKKRKVRVLYKLGLNTYGERFLVR